MSTQMHYHIYNFFGNHSNFSQYEAMISYLILKFYHKADFNKIYINNGFRNCVNAYCVKIFRYVCLYIYTFRYIYLAQFINSIETYSSFS